MFSISIGIKKHNTFSELNHMRYTSLMTRYMHTPSAGGIIYKDGKMLLIYSAGRSTYEFPKGTIEDNESIEETAIREIKEETGYDGTITHDLGSETYDYTDQKTQTPYRKTVSYFLMTPVGGGDDEKNLQGGEDFENIWVTPDEALRRLTYPNTHSFVDAAMAIIEPDDGSNDAAPKKELQNGARPSAKLVSRRDIMLLIGSNIAIIVLAFIVVFFLTQR